MARTAGYILKNPADILPTGILCDFTNESDTILVSFAGNAGMFGMPVFEYKNFLKNIPTKKIFVRDPHMLWYHKGIPGIGSNVDEIADYLKGILHQANPKRTLMVGNSAGGYAAILFGVLTEADEVHAFVPQSKLLNKNDFRNKKNLDKLHSQVGTENKYYDLNSLLTDICPKKTKIYIHTPLFNRIDRHHVKYIKNNPHVKLIRYCSFGHYLTKILRDSGILRTIITSAIKNKFEYKSYDKKPFITMSYGFYLKLRKFFKLLVIGEYINKIHDS